MWISSAYAADTAPAAGVAGEPSPLMSMAPMLLIGVVLYMLVLRPQQKKIKDHQEMIKALRRGDKIVTGGGVIGVISKIEDDVVVLEVAPEIKIRVLLATISHVMTKTVANDNAANDK